MGVWRRRNGSGTDELVSAVLEGRLCDGLDFYFYNFNLACAISGPLVWVIFSS